MKCRTAITAIQKMRRLESCTVYYSCHTDQHEFRCGFVINKRLRHLVSAFTPLDQRIVIILIRAKFYNISFICAHALTEYKYPGHEAKIIFGDFNAKIGREGTFGLKIGPFSLHRPLLKCLRYMYNCIGDSTRTKQVTF